MSDTNTNNDAINNKNNNNINGPDVGNFLLYYALGMLGIVLWVLFGTAWLYISKLVISGIPTDTKYEPYSCDIDPKLGKNADDNKSVKVSMNSIHQLGMKGLAFWQMWSNDSPANKWQQEATFDTQEFLASFDGSLIQEFRDSANIRGTGSAAATGFDKFCSIVLNNVAARGFKWYDTFSLSNKLNDSFKIFIYGLFGLILFPIIWVLNGMCSFYYLCKAVFIPEKPDDINNGGANDILGFIIKLLGEDESGPGGVKNWFKYIGRGFIWLIFWLLIFPILTFFVCPLYATFMPFFKLLWSGSYSLKVDNKFYDSEQSDTKSFWDFIKDTFAYKRTFLLFLAILNLFTCANTYLGEMYFGAVGLAVVLAIVFGDIFVNTAPNDNTMILQQNEYKPKPPKSRRQPIHKGCMFPEEINRIDETLRKLNKELTSLIQQSQSVLPNSEITRLITDLNTVRATLNEEFTVISMSEVEATVVDFGKKITDEYESKITQLEAKIEEAIKEKEVKEKAAKDAEEKAAKDAEEKAAKEKKIQDEADKEERNRATASLNTAAGSEDTSTAAGSSSGLNTGLDTGLDRLSITSSSSSRPSITSNNYSVPVDRGELITYVNDRNPQSVQGKQTVNPMLSAGVSTQGEELTQKPNIKSTIASDTNKLTIDPSTKSNPTLAQQRAKDSGRSTDIPNPMFDMTTIGKPGDGQLKLINKSQVNSVPMSNHRDTSNNPVPKEELDKRVAGGAESNDTNTNPMQASANTNPGGQKIGGSLNPGILSEGSRLLTLTFPNNTKITLRIGDCIEFTKNGKKQSGKIVDFYKSNSNTNIVDVIFIDLFDKTQSKFIAKTVREGKQEKIVLGELYNPFVGGDTDEARNITLITYPNYRPDGITLTSVFSSQYTDVGVWQTIAKCSNTAAEAASIISDANRNIHLTTDFNTELDRQINNKTGGSKSKTLKKKQQNIKIRLV